MPRAHLAMRVAPVKRMIPAGIPVSPALRALSDGPFSSALKFDHPLVTGRMYFSLPKALVGFLEDEFGSEMFDRELWDLEQRLATDTTRQWDRAGFLDGFPLQYGYLFDEPPLVIPDDFRADCGMTKKHGKTIGDTGTDRLVRFRSPVQGYCGWLLTNPVFLAEHDELLTRWAERVYHHQKLPASGNPKLLVPPTGDGTRAAPPPADFVAEFATFYVRWRLNNLAAPYLPCPAAPQVPALIPDRNQPVTGVNLFIPDTFPVPRREQLRDVIEDALRAGGGPEHLAEWHDIVRTGNRAKNSIDHYGRLFVLQHLVAVLYFRHGAAFQGKIGQLKHVLARYLLGDNMAGEDTVHKDLGFIRRRLGADWLAAADVSLAGEDYEAPVELPE